MVIFLNEWSKSSNFPRLSSLKPNISLPNIFYRVYFASFSRKVESDASLLRKSKKISWLCARMSNNCCCSRGDFQISPPTHSSSLLRFSKIGMIILHSFRARNPHTKYLQISSPINANQEPQNHWFYAKKNADGFSANVKTFTQTDWMKNSLHNLSSFFCGYVVKNIHNIISLRYVQYTTIFSENSGKCGTNNGSAIGSRKIGRNHPILLSTLQFSISRGEKLRLNCSWWSTFHFVPSWLFFNFCYTKLQNRKETTNL